MKNNKNIIGGEVIHFDEINSTNTYIKENVNALPNGVAVLTDYQFAGKGRLGRVWSVPKNSALTFSFLLKNPSFDVSLLPALCAMGVTRAIKIFLKEKNLVADVKIKWPNDIVLNNKKICGILCESAVSVNNINVICGIGVNINQPQEYFDESELPYATSFLVEFEESFNKDELFKLAIEEIDTVLQEYSVAGFKQLKPEYVENLVNISRQVQIIYKTKTIIANCIDVADNGNLVSETDDGEIIHINSGEASVRGLYGYV